MVPRCPVPRSTCVCTQNKCFFLLNCTQGYTASTSTAHQVCTCSTGHSSLAFARSSMQRLSSLRCPAPGLLPHTRNNSTGPCRPCSIGVGSTARAQVPVKMAVAQGSARSRRRHRDRLFFLFPLRTAYPSSNPCGFLYPQNPQNPVPTPVKHVPAITGTVFDGYGLNFFTHGLPMTDTRSAAGQLDAQRCPHEFRCTPCWIVHH